MVDIEGDGLVVMVGVVVVVVIVVVVLSDELMCVKLGVRDDEVVVECEVCVIVLEGDVVVRVDCESDDNNARARCRVVGGLIFGMTMLMGTEISSRF